MEQHIEKSNIIDFKPPERTEPAKEAVIVADVENGYTRIANELMDALCTIDMPGRYFKVLNAVIRKTYGYNKKSDWIALSQFVEMTGIEKSNVSRILNDLVRAGILTKTGDGNIKQISINKTVSVWVAPKPKYSIKKEAKIDDKKGLSTPTILSTLTTNIVNPDIKHVEIDNHKRHIQERQIHMSSGDDEHVKTKVKKPVCQTQKIIDIYHAELPELPEVKILTPDRNKKIKARWNQGEKFQSLGFWTKYFKYVRTSDFLMGRSENNRQWSANIDFLIAASSFAKVIEGSYHQGGEK
jgi:phage replication O-like protein O